MTVMAVWVRTDNAVDNKKAFVNAQDKEGRNIFHYFDVETMILKPYQDRITVSGRPFGKTFKAAVTKKLVTVSSSPVTGVRWFREVKTASVEFRNIRRWWPCLGIVRGSGTGHRW